MNSKEYLEITVTISPDTEENQEIALAQISELPYDSFVLEEGNLKCYIQKDLYNASELDDALKTLPFEASFTVAEVPAMNWNAQWEETLQPIVVDNKVTVRFSDKSDSLPRTRFNISLAPEMAFGTGHHETTYMMISAMLRYESTIKGNVVLDRGCGTAVLAILAAKMRASKVVGIDIDMVAVQSALANVRRNRVSGRLDVFCGDASLLNDVHYIYNVDVLLANIHKNIIVTDMKRYSEVLNQGGILLLSGFFESDCEDVAEEARKCGFRQIGSEIRGGWACLHFAKKTSND